MTAPLRVTHMITGLELGGAEMVLYRLLRATDPDEVTSTVISLRGEGPVAALLRDLGVRVRSLDARSDRPIRMIASSFTRLVPMLRATDPQVVQTWMYHADLLGGIAARRAGVSAVAWGLHAGDYVHAERSLITKAAVRLGALLSHRVPRKIVCCSFSARRIHRELGYDDDRMVVIPNGFETFEPRQDAGRRLRDELGVPPEARIVLRVGRDHPQKDLPTFLRAASLIAQAPEMAAVHFVIAGPGWTEDNQPINAKLRAMGLTSRTHLLGPRSDINDLYGAADLAVSSSAYGEAMPLVIGEAMAAGTPVVTTDVGDSARMLDDTGWIVPPGDPQALAGALSDALSLGAGERQERGARAQRRVRDCYSLAGMVGAYQSLYRELAADAQAGEVSR